MSIYWVTVLVSGVVAFALLRLLIPRLAHAGIVGKDMNKPNQPPVAEMGGLGLVGGFGAGALTLIALRTFFKAEALASVNTVEVLAVLTTVLVIALIGLIDDLIGVHQGWKAIIPALAAIPLVVIEVGQKTMVLPLVGAVNLGVLYPVVLVPLGVTGAANAFNMLAGFNGLEAGMGAVAVGTLAIIAASLGEATALTILLAALGALLATLYFNWYPAKIFIGDVGTLTIGTVIATAVIVGNFEWAGVIVILPHALDFSLKARKGFPSTGWWGEYCDGKLYCPAHGPVGLAQLILKLTGGVHERTLVLILIGLEALCGLCAVGFYLVAR
jgi:UDP-N-acetylglucosamine--dolichyl-phosphate N-acetylglucosaminephosphotransferase